MFTYSMLQVALVQGRDDPEQSKSVGRSADIKQLVAALAVLMMSRTDMDKLRQEETLLTSKQMRTSLWICLVLVRRQVLEHASFIFLRWLGATLPQHLPRRSRKRRMLRLCMTEILEKGNINNHG